MADGNSLLRQCQDSLTFANGGNLETLIGAGECLGIIDGTVDGLAIAREFYSVSLGRKLPPIICWPKQEVSKRQALHIVVKYLEEHPENLQKTDSQLITQALMNAFPCSYNR